MPQSKLTLSYSDEEKEKLRKASVIALGKGAPIEDTRHEGASKSAFVRWLVDEYLNNQQTYNDDNPRGYVIEVRDFIQAEAARASSTPMRAKDWEWILSRLEYAIDLLDN